MTRADIERLPSLSADELGFAVAALQAKRIGAEEQTRIANERLARINADLELLYAERRSRRENVQLVML